MTTSNFPASAGLLPAEQSGAANIIARGDIRSLTGVRGIAALAVVFYHYFYALTASVPGLQAFAHGYMAVDLFFVLSGFVMGLTYARRFTGRVPLRTYSLFLARRLGRIYPLYVISTIVVTGMVLLNLIPATPHSAATIASNIMLIQAWGFASSINDPAWSISTEFAAYVIFPVLVSLVFSRRAVASVMTGIIAVGLLGVLAQLDATTLHQVSDGVAHRNGPLDVFGAGTIWPLLRCIAGFVLGLIAFRIWSSPGRSGILAWRHLADVAAIVIAILWLTPKSDIALEIAFVVLVLALATPGSWTAALMATPLVYWLGEISFSIYLIHRPVDYVFRKPAAALLGGLHLPHAYTLAGIPSILLTVMLAAVSFYVIEKPARDVSRRFLPAA